MNYLDRYVAALEFLKEVDEECRLLGPSENEVRAALLNVAKNRERDQYDDLIEKIARPLAEYLFKQCGANENAARRCHVLSDDFLDAWDKFPFSKAYCMSITIGNVIYKGQDVYEIKRSDIDDALRTGHNFGKNSKFHVWLTLDDMTVFDLTIMSSLMRMGYVDKRFAQENPVVIWREGIASDFQYEPILIDNNFARKVDILFKVPLISSGSVQVLPSKPTHFKVPGPNRPCPCGSGRKFKSCCGATV